VKSLRYILAISIVFVSFSAFIFITKAENDPVPSCDLVSAVIYPCVDNKGNLWNTAKERQDAANAAAIAAQKAAENGTIKVCPQSAYTSGVLDFLSITKGVCVFVDFLLIAISSVFAGLMYVCAVLFDFSVDKFILKISTFFLDASGPGGNQQYIYSAWSVVRDMANIAAFFGAVYAGFLRIIGQNQEDFRKAIAKLILFALLTNFSFAISKFAIDMANVVSLQIYGAAARYQFAGNSLGASSNGTIISDYGISSAYMQNMGIQGMVVDTTKVNPSSAFKNINSLTVVIISIIFFIFAGWMFLKAAIFIIVRTFILIGAVVFSPLMFIGGLVPQLTKVHDKWRELFFGNLIVAPLMMIFIWLSLQILGASYKMLGLANTQSGTWAEVLAQTSLLVFGGLSLHLMAKYGEQASGAVGQFAVNVLGGAVGGLATAAATGGVGFVARAGAARAAAAAGSVGKKWVEKEGAGKMRKFAGGMLLKGGERLEKTEVFGKSAFGIRKAAEEKIDGKRETVLREYGQASRDLGWKDKLGQAKSEKEINYIKDQLVQKKKYDSAVHDEEIKNINSKPTVKTDGPRVLEKDKTIANKLHEQIAARDTATDAQIKSEQDQIKTETESLIKTREIYKENQKRGGATEEEMKKTQVFIDNLKAELPKKLTEVSEKLNKQKEEMTDYVGWKAELSGLENEFTKTTLAYKAGGLVSEMIEQDKKDIATVKNLVTNIKPFTTEFDKNGTQTSAEQAAPTLKETLNTEDTKKITANLSKAGSLRSKK
jgi:hypothetical protein